RPFGSGIASKRKDDAPLIFTQNTDGGIQKDEHNDQDGDDRNGFHRFLLGRTWMVRLLGRFDNEDEPLASGHLNLRAGLQRGGAASAPNLAVDSNSPLGALPEQDFASRSKQRFAAGHDG